MFFFSSFLSNFVFLNTSLRQNDGRCGCYGVVVITSAESHVFAARQNLYTFIDMCAPNHNVMEYDVNLIEKENFFIVECLSFFK